MVRVTGDSTGYWERNRIISLMFSLAEIRLLGHINLIQPHLEVCWLPPENPPHRVHCRWGKECGQFVLGQHKSTLALFSLHFYLICFVTALVARKQLQFWKTFVSFFFVAISGSFVLAKVSFSHFALQQHSLYFGKHRWRSSDWELQPHSPARRERRCGASWRPASGSPWPWPGWPRSPAGPELLMWISCTDWTKIVIRNSLSW